MPNKTITEYNRIFHTYLSTILLKDLIDPLNIRPTRQKLFNPLEILNPEYDASGGQSNENKKFNSLQPSNDLVLFFMKQDRMTTRPEIENPTSSSFLRTWEVTYTIYGENCINLSSIIKDAQQLPKALQYLNDLDFSLGNFDAKIETADIIINGQWYSIRKYVCQYHEKVNISLPNLSIDAINKIGEINILKGD